MIDLWRLTHPLPNGRTSAGTYAEDRDGSRDVFCQLTGKECGVFDKDVGITGICDCRSCTVPLTVALINLANAINEPGD